MLILLSIKSFLLFFLCLIIYIIKQFPDELPPTNNIISNLINKIKTAHSKITDITKKQKLKKITKITYVTKKQKYTLKQNYNFPEMAKKKKR